MVVLDENLLRNIFCRAQWIVLGSIVIPSDNILPYSAVAFVTSYSLHRVFCWFTLFIRTHLCCLAVQLKQSFGCSQCWVSLMSRFRSLVMVIVFWTRGYCYSVYWYCLWYTIFVNYYHMRLHFIHAEGSVLTWLKHVVPGCCYPVPRVSGTG